MKRIRLELARDPDFPEGSSRHGYEFVAPLGADGYIDADAWKKVRQQCRVVRFWEGEEDEIGHLVRKPGGFWAFHYDILGDAEDDESGYRFESHVFRPGEYVSIRDQDDRLRAFQVISVQELG